MSALADSAALQSLLLLAAMLGLGRLLGEAMIRVRQPAVVGEILAGVLLGPTVLGRLAPEARDFLVPSAGPPAQFITLLATLAVTLYLLVAGMEVDLKSVWRQGRAVVFVGLGGMALPFALAYGLATAAPRLFGNLESVNPVPFALFLGTAMAISALPVIVKTLMDLQMFRTDFAVVVISAATLQDLVGWIVFAVILGWTPAGGAGSALPAIKVTVFTLAFAAFALTFLRGALHRALPWVQAHATWPGGVIGFVVTLGLVGGALGEWIGVHAVFGSFLTGIALGSSSHLREYTRAVVKQFVSSVFAPIFFVSIGLHIDFLASFDVPLVLLLLALACASKILGAAAGARLSGSSPRESWAIGFAMNARGAMEIVLGSIALAHGLIGERLFVALVVMALATSIMSGPAIRRILRRAEPLHLENCLRPAGFVAPLIARDKAEAIALLAERAARLAGLDARVVEQAVMARERTMPTGLGQQLSVPHARLAGLEHPVAVVGLAPQGIDFDAPDGQPARIVVLLLTPPEEPHAQLELIADVASIFRDPVAREKALAAASFTEFKALLRSAPEGSWERPPAA